MTSGFEGDLRRLPWFWFGRKGDDKMYVGMLMNSRARKSVIRSFARPTSETPAAATAGSRNTRRRSCS